MADIFLPPFLDGIISSIGSALHEEINVGWGVKEELESLSRTLSAINALMADAEKKQLQLLMADAEEELQLNTIKDWLRKLEDAACDAEAVIDDFNLAAKQAGDVVVQSKKRKAVPNLCFCFWSCLKKVKFQHEIGCRIKDIRKRLDDIAKDRDQFRLRELSESKPIQTREWPYTSPLIVASTILGREEEKDKLMIELLGSNESISEKPPIVIPIVGLGGLGKTTFAQFVYNDEKVKQHFEVKGWVCASHRFEWRRVTKDIVKSITGGNCEEIHPEIRLQNLLNGKRFLIVIDDVWDNANEYWDLFRVPFTLGDQGSKLIVTTRSDSVCRVISTSAPFLLKGLPYKDCLQLFLRKAFLNSDEEKYPKLVDIGKMIVEKCKGVPLAINTLGGLLTFERKENEWKNVLKSSFWKLPEKENTILLALRLSYQLLPPMVKRCFVFCSLFPKDWMFKKDVLIRLWMALGYLQQDEWRDEEDVGNEYFNVLLRRSFFSHHVLGYTMHDLVHDLAESLAKGECIRLHDNEVDFLKTNNVPQRAQHASLILSENAKKVSFDAIKSSRPLRTFVTLTNLQGRKLDMTFIAKLNYLYVMWLEKGMIERLFNVIGCLRLLRYLDLSGSDIEELPDTLCSLPYLQTLKLEHCRKLKKLPSNTATFTNLRYLNICCCDELTCMPTYIGKLTNLRELTKFTVGKEAGKTIVELKGLNRLKGSFVIERLENVVDGEEAKEAGLNNKQLQNLILQWTWEEAQDGSTDEDVLENLHPHINLERLSLINYRGSCLPSWLSNLPSLKHLALCNCWELASLPDDLGKLESLETLKVMICHKISSLPRCGLPKSLKSLEIIDVPLLKESCENINGSDWAKIAHIPEIRIS